MKKSNFDTYLEKQLEDPAFAARFAEAGVAWDIALQVAALRQKAGLSQAELARRLNTSQQQVSRLESPGYEGHSLSMLRRVAKELNVTVHVSFEPIRDSRRVASVNEQKATYGKRVLKKSAARKRPARKR